MTEWVNNRNCGLCGEKSCEEFQDAVNRKEKPFDKCPFYAEHEKENQHEKEMICDSVDTHGHVFDFLLGAVNGEISARKIIKPFRSDLIEKFNITKGSIVMGRPVGAGCPVTHVMKVYDVDELSGILYTWVVGPGYSRNNDVIDIRSYSMTGFEGIAKNIVEEPKVGKKAGFMPGFCMLRLTHYGLVNMVMETKEGLLVRIEDIHIAN